MNFGEAIQWAVDNEIIIQFRKFEGKIALVATKDGKSVLILGEKDFGWTFKRAFKSLFLPALNKLKAQK